MSKYWYIFKMSLTRALTYRMGFVINRIRNLMVLLLFYSLWTALTKNSTTFAGLTRDELVAYVFIVHIFRSFVFGSEKMTVAEEITTGAFSTYLVKPYSHFWHSFMQELSDRTLQGISAVLEVFGIVVIGKIPLHVHISASQLWIALISLLVGFALYFLLFYSICMVAFWSHEIFGPNFLFSWFISFSSGSYFPLTILSLSLYKWSFAQPGAILIFLPVMHVVSQSNTTPAWQILAMQGGWLALAISLVVILWHRGIRRYSAEGI